MDDKLTIEGLAAQMYAIDRGGNHQVWWHLLRIEIKDEYREKAKVRIDNYIAMCKEMDQKMMKK